MQGVVYPQLLASDAGGDRAASRGWSPQPILHLWNAPVRVGAGRSCVLATTHHGTLTRDGWMDGRGWFDWKGEYTNSFTTFAKVWATPDMSGLVSNRLWALTLRGERSGR